MRQILDVLPGALLPNEGLRFTCRQVELVVENADTAWTREAREGERKEPPPEMVAQMAEMNALADGPIEFFDLTDPWLSGPR